jgi:hypothetical protein
MIMIEDHQVLLDSTVGWMFLDLFIKKDLFAYLKATTMRIKLKMEYLNSINFMVFIIFFFNIFIKCVHFK